MSPFIRVEHKGRQITVLTSHIQMLDPAAEPTEEVNSYVVFAGGVAIGVSETVETLERQLGFAPEELPHNGH